MHQKSLKSSSLPLFNPPDYSTMALLLECDTFSLSLRGRILTAQSLFLQFSDFSLSPGIHRESMDIDKDKSQPMQADLRSQAEELLRAKTTEEPSPGTTEDPLRLLHELQVHQVELEMQNAELRQARDEVDRALEQYSDLFDFAPVGYLTLDRNGTILIVNLTCASLLGIERSRLIGRHFDRLVAAADRPSFASFFEMVITSSARAACEVTLLNKGNSPLFVRIEAMSAASGQQCRITLIDITERKKAEEELLKVEAAAELALRKVEAAAEEALRQVEAADGSFLLSNEATTTARQKLGDAAVVARQNLEEAARTARRGEKSQSDMSQMEKLAAEMALIKVKKAADVALLRVEMAAEVALSKVEANAKALQKVQWAADLLLGEKEAAEAASRTKSQFLANMSHELRTPMTGVLGMLDLVLVGNLEAEQREFIETAQTSARSLVRILNDILDLTKIEAGKLSLEAKPFSVRKCLETTYNLLLPVAKSKGLDFDFEVADKVPEILVGDETRLIQILTNLAGNAVKFTAKGKVELRVAAGGRATDGRREVTFTVTDTGIGIPADKKHLLFRVFSQVDDSHTRSYGGTGLGLAICKELVERMGGTITFTSEEGKGSTFSFALPLGETEAAQGAIIATAKTAPAGDSPLAAELTKPRLLIAEDDPTIRQVLGLMFQRSYFEVEIAEDGEKVVEMWGSGQYDLILMDVQMPGMNGFEATAAIRQKERTSGGHIPIVAMTAHALKEDEDRCLATGMDGYISKPIDFKKSLQVIRDILNPKM
jgi:PAS domain S-box-containing protein